MKNLASKTKQELLSDLLLCITYEKDRENDLLCMTEQYQLYYAQRKELEETMLELLQGNPYCTSFLLYHCYDQCDILVLEDLLDRFPEEIATSKIRNWL